MSSTMKPNNITDCPEDPFNPLATAIIQISCMLVIAHIFHLIFKPLGQPGPISQILAGLVLSPTLLSRINKVREFFIQDTSAFYYKIFDFISRVLFMFLFGLETDVTYLRLNFRVASTVALGGILMSIIFGISASIVFLKLLAIKINKVAFTIVVSILLANSASPVVMRVIDELKFDTAEVGRLAKSSSLINEISCVLVMAAYLVFSSSGMLGNAIWSIIVTIALVILNRYMARWFAMWNKKSKYVSNAQVLVILVFIVFVSLLIEGLGFSSILICFLLGMMFPREGKTTRTLFKKLTYSIHNFILPIYFGYMGFQFDASDLNTIQSAAFVLILVLSSFVAKLVGTMAATHHLKIPRIKAVLLGFILNLKGNYEYLIIHVNVNDRTWWSTKVHNLLLVVVVLNTLISGTIVAFIMKRKENYFAHKDTSLEQLSKECEFRMLACAYEPRHASGQLVLTAALSGSIAPYLIHLVELPKKRRKNTLMYNQLEDGGNFSDEEEYGGNDVLEINDAVDAFTIMSKIRIQQMKVVNNFANIYEDVCNTAEDLRVSMIMLPFHKHQRIDKQMENGKEGYRTTNQKILRHAPCSVGVFVHRDQTGIQQPIGYEKAQPVATLFFGGLDDREALAYSTRIASNTNINLTVIRFRPIEPSGKQPFDAPPNIDDVLMSLSISKSEYEKDIVFIEDFRLRYVTSGRVGYIEKYVNSGEETVEALREVRDMEFSLLIVGKGGRGRSPLTTGLSDWEECPELGTVGDLLASVDFNLKSSMLIIQQHRHHSDTEIVSS
ncbi:hypothetical protein ACOSQ2_033307 [Xanthoceras sorbifolium]|uniref:Cation/H+ exchanger domain-containing protein n=1 Tax=Xanthoceras sorbifolium TaxID=99658 RepID=A0ABQ8H3D6_9ROSI|nr:hypothetical protein JRO89_XS14G0019000 [Xanthoceras sorbifolium]